MSTSADSVWSTSSPAGPGLWQPAACDQDPVRKRKAIQPLGIENDYKIELHHGVEGLDDLACDWRHLERAARSPTEQFIWQRSAAKAFHHSDRLQTLTVSNGEGLLAAAPLVSRPSRATRARLLGVGELWEPTDFAAVNQEARLILLRNLIRLGRPLHFERLPAASPTLTLGAAVARGRASLVRRASDSCPYITLDETWLDPASHLNSGRRSDLRRAQRAAEKLGPVTSEILAPWPSVVAPLLDEVFAVEASGWKGEAGSALVRDAARAGFFRRYAAEAARLGILRLCFLRIGGVAVATQFAVETCGKFWLLKIGYAEEFQRCSPGMLLLRDTIAYAARQGLAGYEFLGRAAPWIRVWTPLAHEQVGLRIYPWGLRGAAALASDGAATTLRRLQARRADKTKRTADEAAPPEEST